MSRFRTYLEKTFSLTPHESEEVMNALVKPLKKSIRINTQKISRDDFIAHAKLQSWTLTETDIPEVFLIDRDDTSIALGNTLEHQAGWFYIQELAAAHPPHLLREQITQHIPSKDSRFPDTILDMCAAPGGKTTQLADYFPSSLVIANEVNRSRTPQLFDNLDRMGYDNIAVVSCDGRFFQNFPEYFDAVLLDAPCSGEGTAFRDDSVIRHWHEKNIRRIAKLQRQLFETTITIVKPGGFISYSTCTLNQEENEGVINNKESTIKNQPLEGGLRQLFEKRFWPHREHTGGFFASVFHKGNASIIPHHYPTLPLQGQKPLLRPATKGERETIERFIEKQFHTSLTKGYLFVVKDTVYFHHYNLGPLMQYFFFVHAGAKIGTLRGNEFTPSLHLYWYLEETSHIPSLRLPLIAEENYDAGWYRVFHGKGVLGLFCVHNGELIFS